MTDYANAWLKAGQEARAWQGRAETAEAEIARLREERDALKRWQTAYAKGRSGIVEQADQDFARAEAAEARCARLQQALEHVRERALHDQEPDYELIDRALAGLDTPADSQEDKT